MFRILLFILFFIVFSSSAFELIRRFEQTQFIVLESEPLDEADSLLGQQRWQEASYLASVIREKPGLGDSARAKSIELAATTALDSLPINSRDFLEGAISGEANNGSALLGALALDLFVIGDIRDLLVQGYKQLNNQDGDKIIMALSATGLSLTLLPEFHWAPAIMKGLKRSGSFSLAFSKNLSKLASRALDTGNFKPLASLVSDFGQAASKLGLGPIKGAMRSVHSADDLKKLSKAASLAPKQTYALANLAGQRGIKQLNKSGDNIPGIVKKLKRTSRLAKVAKKSFGALPTAFVVSIFILSIILMSSLMLMRRKTA